LSAAVFDGGGDFYRKPAAVPAQEPEGVLKLDILSPIEARDGSKCGGKVAR
jgi:hypothetical protein